MDNSVITIAGAAGAALGAVLKSYAPDLLAWLKPADAGAKRIKFRWKASWYRQENGQMVLHDEDQVDVEKVSGLRFTARGIANDGTDYRIEGCYHSHAIITFTYRSIENDDIRAGSGSLNANATYTELTGYWSGHTQDNKHVTGTVKWVRLRA